MAVHFRLFLTDGGNSSPGITQSVRRNNIIFFTTHDFKCSVAVVRLRALIVEVATTVVSSLCFGVVKIRISKICDETSPYNYFSSCYYYPTLCSRIFWVETHCRVDATACTVVLAWPDAAKLHKADGMWYDRHGMAVPDFEHFGVLL